MGKREQSGKRLLVDIHIHIHQKKLTDFMSIFGLRLLDLCRGLLPLESSWYCFFPGTKDQEPYLD